MSTWLLAKTTSVGKTTDSYDALATAIAEAEAAVKDGNATEESLDEAAQNLQEAIDGLTRAANYVELSASMFKHYASLDNPGEGEATGCAYETFTASDLPYGDGMARRPTFPPASSSTMAAPATTTRPSTSLSRPTSSTPTAPTSP